MARHNYLNNKDILKEIHKSKNTYCCFINPEDHAYDMILADIAKINKKNIMAARKARAERLTKLAHETALLETGIKRRVDEFEVKLKDVLATDVVFRVMTWDHIPVDDVKSRKAAIKAMDEEGIPHSEYDDDTDIDISNSTKYVKVNFPPFEHYKVNPEGEPVLVGRSHWKGTLKKGEFSRDHGKMTNKLATMFIKLCERYATRSNWRGYTYNDEMRSQALLQLSQIGLQFDEFKSQNPFAYYTAAVNNSFTRVLNIEKRNQNLRDDILEMNNLTPSYTRQGQSSSPGVWAAGGGGGFGGEVSSDD
jgi:hypothetical protein